MPLQNKIERFLSGNTPRVLDLFAGCGGISLGFHKAGFNIIGAVEVDPHAARTHALNFCRDEPEAIREIHANPRDITTLEPADLLEELGYFEPVDEVVDIIVGGPPCQAYTRVGRAKLREVAEHPDAYLQDARGNLYLRYLHYVAQLQPLALVMENVPDVLNYGGHNVAEEMCEVLDEMGYTCNYTLLNSSFYGVPQMRERMFLIAYRQELGVEVTFPAPTHWVDLPRGYHGSRQVALRNVVVDLFGEHIRYVEVPREFTPDSAPAVSAKEALGDLPAITTHLEGTLKRGTRRFNDIQPYRERPKSPYTKLMRNWPGFENNVGIGDHVIRSLPRDYKLFRRMLPGDQYPEAYQHAQEMFQEELKARREVGQRLEEGSEEYKQLYSSIVPPYDPGKFPNKWRKMEPDMPARTLMAHLGKDCYSHIHYDSEQARTISVREAARLQSFPDGFKFSGTMNPAFKQIGNAVPPLLSYAVGRTMMTTLNAVRIQDEA
ncbi:DNA cytosine methyltransferase [Pontibacter toksunensis]|uniref:DNA (cytosine-5-)-methyltransferase n=1 Tax=Pontibacter toksunensis TaxID=1332631 RepID=A0ABW6BZ62_9BACT